MIKYIWILIYYTINATAFTLSYFGGISEHHFWLFFIFTNIVGMSGTWVLMQLYKKMDANIATAITLGGGFLITQTVIAAIFGNTLSFVQYIGVVVIAGGLFCMVRRDKPEGGESGGDSPEAENFNSPDGTVVISDDIKEAEDV